MSIPTRIFGFLLICTLLCFPVAWGKNETPRESQKILEKSNVELTPDTNQKFSDLELKIKRVEKELGKINAKINEVNQRVLLHDEALLSKDEPPMENWRVALISILGALGASMVGGLLVGHFQKKAVQQDHQNAMDRQEREEITQVHSFLEGIHNETKTLWKLYNKGIGQHLEDLPPGQPFLTLYMADNDYPPVFKSSSHLLGKIKDSNLRRSIIEFYIMSNEMVNTFALNNQLVEKWEHSDILFAETHSPIHKQRLDAYYKLLTDYAPQIKEYHASLKRVAEELFQNLRTSGVYHRD